ncbi:MAG: hypothetical protein MUD05_01025 [Candidatus Nanopelagicales bacterium]|nr:hypothetical protein [Candidatus Nanopelagicales bacterium]
MNRPVGQVTRGTTGSNRLRRFDRWINHLCGQELRRTNRPLAVDLGFGAHPATSVEWQRALARINPQTRVVGVEIDRGRVAAADGVIEAIHGGFEIPTTDRPLVIRAANVLRQYPEEQVQPAWALMASRLAAGGWLIDGTCDEQGRLSAMVSIDTSAEPRWLTLSCRLAGLERPGDLAARLPKVLIHHNTAGHWVHDLFTDMDRAWERAPRWGARQRWISMAGDLAANGWVVRDGPARWRLGEISVAWPQPAHR